MSTALPGKMPVRLDKWSLIVEALAKSLYSETRAVMAGKSAKSP
jgi:hypothetical protein